MGRGGVNICFVSRVFQRANDLLPSGEPDQATLEAMRRPRCGLEDPFNKKHHRYRVISEFTAHCIGCGFIYDFFYW